MPKAYTDAELRAKGVKIPHVVEKPKPKDPSVQAMEAMARAVSDTLKAQDTFREEMKGILQTVAVALKDGRIVSVEMPEMDQWEELDIAVTARDNDDLLKRIRIRRVK